MPGRRRGGQMEVRRDGGQERDGLEGSGAASCRGHIYSQYGITNAWCDGDPWCPGTGSTGSAIVPASEPLSRITQRVPTRGSDAHACTSQSGEQKLGFNKASRGPISGSGVLNGMGRLDELAHGSVYAHSGFIMSAQLSFSAARVFFCHERQNRQSSRFETVASPARRARDQRYDFMVILYSIGKTQE
jgi:hypothetical protein